MNRHLGAYVAFVAFGFITSIGFAQAAPPKLGDSTLNKPTEMQKQQLIKEIKAIREQLGGSVAEQLKDLGIDSPSKNAAEREFDRELTRLATQADSKPAGPPLSSRGTTGSFRGPSSKILGPKRLPGLNPPQYSRFPNVAPLRKPVASHNSIDRLRLAARRLEEMAADLETANLYHEADEIRDQARKFWLQARGIKIIRTKLGEGPIH